MILSMKPIFNKIFLKHNISHIENPCRFSFLSNLQETPIENGERHLRSVHTRRYIEKIRDCCEKGEKFYGAPTLKDTYDVACYAVGAALLASEEEGFAIVRPPGHHAAPDLPRMNVGSGYCFFNDIAIATKNLLNKGRKVLVLDFDLHHGNGTEDCLMGLENVMHISTHQELIWPWSGKRSIKNCINITYSYGTEDKEYLSRLEPVLLSSLRDFSPDVIGIYAGFDGYHKDNGCILPNQGFCLTTHTYSKILDMVDSYRKFGILGGGYNPESLGDCIDLFIQ